MAAVVAAVTEAATVEVEVAEAGAAGAEVIATDLAPRAQCR